MVPHRIPQTPKESLTLVQQIKQFFYKLDSQLDEGRDSNEEPSPQVLEVRNIHKTYLLGLGKLFEAGSMKEGVPAIRGVDLQVFRGEFVIIVGKSGSGNSSLLNILGTVDSPTRGEMTVSGFPFNDKTNDRTVSSIRLQAIGFVFQTFNLIPGMTAAQNVELPLILKVSVILLFFLGRLISVAAETGCFRATATRRHDRSQGSLSYSA